MNIHSIESFGTHEGPGIRFVIFTQGCNFRCLYCHNPDTQRSDVGRRTSVDELIEMIEKDRPYFGDKGGVTVSGGEPLLQAREITSLFKKLKESPTPSNSPSGRGRINTVLDTNGSILTSDVKELLKYTDLVLLDIKHVDPAWHEKITGWKNPNNVILSVSEESPGKGLLQGDPSAKPQDDSNCVPSITFANYLESENIKFWIRYVLVPGYTDQPEYLEKMAHDLSKYKSLERIEILPYHTMGEYKYEELNIEYRLKNVEPPTKEEVEKAKGILEKSGRKVLVR